MIGFIKMDSTIKCYYCDTSSRVFGDVIKHSIDKHENQTLQVKLESATDKFTFTIKPIVGFLMRRLKCMTIKLIRIVLLA